MGQPLVSCSTQTLYLIVGLYRSPEAGETTAFTRVVFVPELLRQRGWPPVAEVERRLLRYVEAHGDGWYRPEPLNTFRLACFARVLDAVTEAHELTDYVDKTTGDWFSDQAQRDGSIGMRNEAAFYRRCGVDLAAVEEQVRLSAGDLLVIDNVRAVHGRFGKRRPQELFQFLYGVRSGNLADIDAIRAFLVGAFAAEAGLQAA
jgi:hypothetical protein